MSWCFACIVFFPLLNWSISCMKIWPFPPCDLPCPSREVDLVEFQGCSSTTHSSALPGFAVSVWWLDVIGSMTIPTFVCCLLLLSQRLNVSMTALVLLIEYNTMQSSHYVVPSYLSCLIYLSISAKTSDGGSGENSRFSHLKRLAKGLGSTG